MKFMTLSLLIIGIIVIFNFGGIKTPTTGLAVNLMMDLDAEGESAQSPISRFMEYKIDLFASGVKVSIWAFFISIVGVLTLVGARAGLFGSAPPISFYLAPFVIGFASIVLIDMSALFFEIWKYSLPWLRMVYTSIFIPISIMYILSVKSFMEGTD